MPCGASIPSLHNLDASDYWLAKCPYVASRRFRYAVVAKNERLVTPLPGRRGCAPPIAGITEPGTRAAGEARPANGRMSVTSLSFLATLAVERFRHLAENANIIRKPLRPGAKEPGPNESYADSIA